MKEATKIQSQFFWLTTTYKTFNAYPDLKLYYRNVNVNLTCLLSTFPRFEQTPIPISNTCLICAGPSNAFFSKSGRCLLPPIVVYMVFCFVYHSYPPLQLTLFSHGSLGEFTGFHSSIPCFFNKYLRYRAWLNFTFPLIDYFSETRTGMIQICL